MIHFMNNETAVLAVILYAVVAIPWLRLFLKYRNFADGLIVFVCLYHIGAYALREYYLPDFPPEVNFIFSLGTRLLLPAVLGYWGIRRYLEKK